MCVCACPLSPPLPNAGHHTAHKSTFLHPIIEYHPKNRDGWVFGEDAPASSIHLVEDVQALWETEAEHLDPLRSWIAHLILNITIADVLSDVAFLDDADAEEAEASSDFRYEFICTSKSILFLSRHYQYCPLFVYM